LDENRIQQERKYHILNIKSFYRKQRKITTKNGQRNKKKRDYQDVSS
jgi:hypothetical protein